MISVPVALGERSYQVQIGAGILQDAGTLVHERLGKKRLAVVTDSNVAQFHLKPLLVALEFAGFEVTPITVPAGEPSKSLQAVEQVCDEMVAARHDRGSAVIALGGGVIGDLAGFVAGIYFRGVPCVQIPTTIMAQVDSSVGGKTGVNTRSAKNLLGVFHQPAMVLADVETLLTLPDRAFFEGFAEVIKHGVIRDRELFYSLSPLLRHLPDIRSKNSSLDSLTKIIQRNVEIKAAVVAEDEYETKNIRALLNFGHTIGHAIEAVAGYGSFLHGEAISLGMVAAARLSCKKAGLPTEDRDQIINLLESYHLPVHVSSTFDSSAVLKAMLSDKKFCRGSIRFILSSGIGNAYVSQDITMSDIESEIAALSDHAR